MVTYKKKTTFTIAGSKKVNEETIEYNKGQGLILTKNNYSMTWNHETSIDMVILGTKLIPHFKISISCNL